MPRPMPTPGQAVKETIFTEVVNSSESPAPRTNRPPFWDYCESLSPEDWRRHSVWIKRYDEKGDKVWLDKFDGEQLAVTPLNPLLVKRSYGGGKYNFMMKDGSQLIYNFDDKFEGARIEPGTQPMQPSNNGLNGGSETSQLAREIVSLLRDQISRPDPGNDMVIQGARNALDIQKTAFQSASATLNPAAAAAPSRSDQILDKLFDLLLSKLLNPSDPIETFSKMATAMQPFIAKQGSGSSSVAVELMKNAPSLVHEIAEGLKNIAAIQHNQISAAMLARGGPMPPQHLPPAQPAAVPVPTQAATQPTPGPHIVQPPPPAAVPPRQPWQDMMEYQVSNILMNQEMSIDDQVSEVLTIMDSISPAIAEAICKEGEKSIFAILDNGPHLPKVPRGLRLSEFITKFLTAVTQKGAVLVPEPPPAV